LDSYDKYGTGIFVLLSLTALSCSEKPSLAENRYGKAVSHIKLYREGPNGVPDGVAGIFVHNPDSIWLYCAMRINPSIRISVYYTCL
jgi:hypothetical protein